MTAYGIQDITADLSTVSLVPIITFFSGVRLKDIQRPTGKVDLLLGVHEARLFPRCFESHDNLLLQRYAFGSGLLLSGYHPRIKSGEVFPPQQSQALHVRSHHVPAEYTSSYPAASVNPTSAGGGGVQGDCRNASCAPRPEVSLSRDQSTQTQSSNFPESSIPIFKSSVISSNSSASNSSESNSSVPISKTSIIPSKPWLQVFEVPISSSKSSTPTSNLLFQPLNPSFPSFQFHPPNPQFSSKSSNTSSDSSIPVSDLSNVITQIRNCNPQSLKQIAQTLSLCL